MCAAGREWQPVEDVAGGGEKNMRREIVSTSKCHRSWLR